MRIKQILKLYISDIDECATGSAECNHYCQNTAGNYYCTCYGSGYRLQDDNSTCLSKLVVRLYYNNIVCVLLLVLFIQYHRY